MKGKIQIVKPFLKSWMVFKMITESFKSEHAILMAARLVFKRLYFVHMQNILQGIHAESNVHSRAVRKEGSQSSLNKQAKDQDSVPVEQ